MTQEQGSHDVLPIVQGRLFRLQMSVPGGDPLLPIVPSQPTSSLMLPSIPWPGPDSYGNFSVSSGLLA